MRLVSYVERSTLTEDVREQNDKRKYLELSGSKYIKDWENCTLRIYIIFTHRQTLWPTVG